MKIISMAWTSAAFKAGRKWVTRRDWTREYAARFKVDDVCQVFDRSPRFGGRRIGFLKILSLTYEPMKLMPSFDFELEGFAFMEERGLKIWGREPRQAFEDWRREDKFYWVVRFMSMCAPTHLFSP